MCFTGTPIKSNKDDGNRQSNFLITKVPVKKIIMFTGNGFFKCKGTGKNKRKQIHSDYWQQNFIIFKVTVIVKVGKNVVKTIKA